MSVNNHKGIKSYENHKKKMIAFKNRLKKRGKSYFEMSLKSREGDGLMRVFVISAVGNL